MPDEQDPARKHQAYLEEWLRRHGEQTKLAPTVRQMLGTAVWQGEAIGALRQESPEMAREIESELASDYENLRISVPLPTAYTATASLSGTAFSSGANERIVVALVAARGPHEEPAGPLTRQINRYVQLQTEQGRAEEAARRLEELFPGLRSRFSDALAAAQVAGPDRQAQESAAFAMRTCLDKLKGELFALATKHGAQNVDWERMAESLALPHAQRALAEQGEKRTFLVGVLSSIGKERASSLTVDEAQILFVDHVYVVCGLVLAGLASP